MFFVDQAIRKSVFGNPVLNKKKSQMVSNHSNMPKNNLPGKVVKRESD